MDKQHFDLSGTSVHTSGIQREVLAWVGVGGTPRDYRCRRSGKTEDSGGQPNLATGRNRFEEYGPVEARKRLSVALGRNRHTEKRGMIIIMLGFSIALARTLKRYQTRNHAGVTCFQKNAYT